MTSRDQEPERMRALDAHAEADQDPVDGTPTGVLDASVLILFTRAGHLHVLQELFPRLSLPEEVQRECVHAKPQHDDARRIQAEVDAGRIEVVSPPQDDASQITTLHPHLDGGETRALSWTSGLPRGTLLTDDGAARTASTHHGVPVAGCLGVLLAAYDDGVLPDRGAVAEALAGLLDAGLWVSGQVVERFWREVGGRP